MGRHRGVEEGGARRPRRGVGQHLLRPLRVRPLRPRTRQPLLQDNPRRVRPDNRRRHTGLHKRRNGVHQLQRRLPRPARAREDGRKNQGRRRRVQGRCLQGRGDEAPLRVRLREHAHGTRLGADLQARPLRRDAQKRRRPLQQGSTSPASSPRAASRARESSAPQASTSAPASSTYSRRRR